MPWFRIDDGFHEHPKVEALEADPTEHALAIAAWTLVGSACSRRLTDGIVTRAALAKALAAWPEKLRARAAAALVRVGLWVEHEDGWAYHDWLDYQPSRADTERERELSRRRQAEWKRNRRSPGGGGNGGANGGGNAVTGPVTPPVATPAPSRPVPSRPDRSDLRSSRESAREERSLADLACSAWTRVLAERGRRFQPDPSKDAGRFRAIGQLVDAMRGDVALTDALEASARRHIDQRRTGTTPEYWLEWLQRDASRAPQTERNGVSPIEDFDPSPLPARTA